jgi:hypothetical protein
MCWPSGTRIVVGLTTVANPPGGRLSSVVAITPYYLAGQVLETLIASIPIAAYAMRSG